MNAVELTGVKKTIGRLNLNIDILNIPQGKITGIYGIKQTGKSTIIKLITGIDTPDKGRITVLSGDLYHNPELKGQIGFIPDKCGYNLESKIKDIVASIRSFYKNWDKELFETLSQKFKLEMKTKLKLCSAAVKIKLAYAIALAHHPRLIIIDVLSSSVDSIVSDGIMQIVKQYMDKDTTIIFTTKSSSDLDKWADYFAILRKGEITDFINKEEYMKNCVIVRGDTTAFEGRSNNMFRGMRINDNQFEALAENRDQIEKMYGNSVQYEKPTVGNAVVFLSRGDE